MNENQIDKDHNLNIVRQTSFLSNIEPNLSTNHTFTIIKKTKKGCHGVKRKINQ